MCKLSQYSQNERVELHLQTTYSAMNALTPVEKVIKRAAEYGHPAIAITDYSSVQAFDEAYCASKKYGIKVIYGLECDCVDDSTESKPYRIIILVRNEEGMKNLYGIVSEFGPENLCVSKSFLENHRKGLLIGTPGYKGEIGVAILNGYASNSISTMMEFYDYVEISPRLSNVIVDGRKVTYEMQQELNCKLSRLAERTHRPLVATGNVHFLEKEDEICERVLLATKGVDFSNESIPLYFRTTGEMLEEFRYLGEKQARYAVIDNTQNISAFIDERLNPLPKCTKLIEIKGTKEKIEEKCRTRLEEIYGEEIDSKIISRLDFELNALSNSNSAILFTLADEIINDSKISGHIAGTGWCFSASLVAFLLGITDINPLPPHYICPRCKHTCFVSTKDYDIGLDLPDVTCPICASLMEKDGFNMYAETLFGLNSEKTPDINLCFCSEYYPVACKSVDNVVGDNNVFQSTIMKRVKNSFELTERYFEDNELDLDVDELVKISEKLYLVKRGEELYEGLYLLAPNKTNITDFTPIYKRDGKSVSPFSPFELMKRFNKVGIREDDALSLLNELKLETGIAPFAIPLDDNETLNAFINGDTVGVIGVETAYMRNAIELTKPKSLSDLIRLYSLTHGTNAWKDNSDSLFASGKVNLSEVITSRDDVMSILLDKEMPREEAYRYMEKAKFGKLHSERGGDEWKEEFRKYKVEEKYIDSLQKIEYLYPKAHATVRIINAFRLMWYKVHFTTQFYSAVLNLLNKTNCFTPHDFETIPYFIEKELKILIERNDERKDEYLENRINFLEVLMEMMKRGYYFTSFYQYEIKKDMKRFEAGRNKMIRNFYCTL